MPEIYGRNQARVLFDVWPEEPVDWFVVGGVATSNEAQTIHTRYPNLKYIGFEPNPVMREQAAPNFPGISYPYALWEENKALTLEVPDQKDLSSSVCRPFDAPLPYHIVEGRTLDSLSGEYGPFTNCVLWIDIEMAELAALKGATNLLTNHIKLINLETMYDEQLRQITELLQGFGFVEAKRWGHGQWADVNKWDVVFKKKELL